jgi:hypothetical protein
LGGTALEPEHARDPAARLNVGFDRRHAWDAPGGVTCGRREVRAAMAEVSRSLYIATAGTEGRAVSGATSGRTSRQCASSTVPGLVMPSCCLATGLPAVLFRIKVPTSGGS